MKTTNIIQRLGLFFFVLVLAAPAWATNFGCARYEIFRSRNLGKHQTVTTLRKGKVEITFSRCNTTGGTGSGAIYELAKGSRITVKAIDGYRIRWIILRDTEGGKRYSHKDGIKRINRVTSGYNYYFEKNAISNSKIKEGNQQDLNDDDNNIVVYQNDASAQSVDIVTHNNSDWDQFKVRDIIVGVVNELHVKYQQEEYSTYTVGWGIAPGCTRPNRYTGLPKYKVDNEYVATVNNGGIVNVKHPGTVVLTATFPPDEWFSGAECSTKVHVLRDKVTFTAKDLSDMLYTPYNFRSLLQTSTLSDKEFRWDNPQFSITSSNSSVLSCDNGMLKPGGTSGEATITVRQEENDFYEPASFSHTFIVVRREDYSNGAMLIKDANEWKLFCKLVSEKGHSYLDGKLEADINLGTDIAMVGMGEYKFRGKFDGQDHYITMNWSSDRELAPFYSIENATIQNVKTRGEITLSKYSASGLIREASGTCTISNCFSNVNITAKGNTNASCAGLIRYINGGAKVTISDCLVAGMFNGTNDKSRRRWGGFVGDGERCTFNNCLYIGKNNATDNSYTFGPNAKLNRCYYLNNCGNKQGEQVTADQLKSGEVAYLLQDRRADRMWGQNIGKDNEPLLTDDATKRVYQVSFAYNGKVKATRYANSGGRVTLPTAKELLGADYDAQKSYTLTFENGFSETTAINGDITVSVTVNVVTGIDGVTDDNADMNAPVYDLQGRRVADRLDDARHQLPAGVYIVGGRKVIVK